MPTTINRGSERQLKVTVGQVQAGKAVLLTDDLQILEVPASLLPLNTGGSPCLTLTLSPREDSNDRLQSLVTKLKDGPAKAAESLKEAIERDGFLYVHHRSHCTVTARWASYASLPLSKYGQLFGIDGYVNGHKMIGSHIDAIGDDETELRLTGLSPNSDYDVQLVFRTATGTFRSRSIRVHTPALDDFSGLSIAVDSQWPSEERQRVHGIIKELGGEISQEIGARTTQLISDLPDSPMVRAAHAANLPVVTFQWLDACRLERKVASVSQFYSCLSLDKK